MKVGALRVKNSRLLLYAMKDDTWYSGLELYDEMVKRGYKNIPTPGAIGRKLGFMEGQLVEVRESDDIDKRDIRVAGGRTKGKGKQWKKLKVKKMEKKERKYQTSEMHHSCGHVFELRVRKDRKTFVCPGCGKREKYLG